VTSGRSPHADVLGATVRNLPAFPPSQLIADAMPREQERARPRPDLLQLARAGVISLGPAASLLGKQERDASQATVLLVVRSDRLRGPPLDARFAAKAPTEARGVAHARRHRPPPCFSCPTGDPTARAESPGNNALSATGSLRIRYALLVPCRRRWRRTYLQRCSCSRRQSSSMRFRMLLLRRHPYFQCRR
jgi:hypothetical protein